MKKHNVVVTGTGSLIGQAIIKSLKRSELSNKIRIIGCDYFSETVGSFWCDKNYLLPDVLKGENKEQWQKKIIKIIEDEDAEVLLVGVDFELILFSELKDEIESKTRCKLVISNRKVLEIGNDKFLTYQFLKDNNLNFPKTWLPEEINQAKIEFPCVVKPRVGARSKGVFIVNNRADLEEKIISMPSPIVQELIGDPSLEYTCGVIFYNGQLIDSIALHRFLKEGNTSIAEYKKSFDPKIYDYIHDIARKLEPHGSCNFQLRISKEGVPILFEINPRFSGTTYMRSLFGFNEVERIVNFVLNYSSKPFSLSEGRAYRYYEEALLV